MKTFKSTICLVLALTLLGAGTCSVGFAGALQPINGGPGSSGQPVDPKRDYFQGPLKVVSLNLAHGRKTAFSQIFLSWQTIHKNLEETAGVLNATAADIVALQEADGPSWWSGNFDHVARLAERAGFPWYSRAGHMDAWSLHYGTALMARRPYLETRAHRFQSSLPTPAKGFLLARFGWYPGGGGDPGPVFVDVVSVHLDFSRQQVRTRQIAEMRAMLADRKNPLIILGDFNSDWFSDDSVVRRLARRTGLQVYHPEATDLGTYGTNRRRLDWILISAELAFISYRVLAERLSDHRAVVAEIGLKP